VLREDADPETGAVRWSQILMPADGSRFFDYVRADAKAAAGERIVEAIRAIPYQKGVDSSAIYDVGADGEQVTHEMVADYIESLLPMLVQVARDEATNERELSQMRADLRAAGRLLKLMGVV
jgi:hypothetical protein